MSSSQNIVKLVAFVLQYIADLVVNHKVRIDPDVKKGLEDGSIKSPKKHPGIVTVKAVKLPKELIKAMETLLESKDD